jgi:hypothetical protein
MAIGFSKKRFLTFLSNWMQVMNKLTKNGKREISHIVKWKNILEKLNGKRKKYFINDYKKKIFTRPEDKSPLETVFFCLVLPRFSHHFLSYSCLKKKEYLKNFRNWSSFRTEIRLRTFSSFSVILLFEEKSHRKFPEIGPILRALCWFSSIVDWRESTDDYQENLTHF